MGEMNELRDYPQALADLMEALAHYLYDQYGDHDPMRADDPRNTSGFETEPWESAGKRVRDRWFEEADKLAKHFIDIAKEI